MVDRAALPWRRSGPIPGHLSGYPHRPFDCLASTNHYLLHLQLKAIRKAQCSQRVWDFIEQAHKVAFVRCWLRLAEDLRLHRMIDGWRLGLYDLPLKRCKQLGEWAKTHLDGRRQACRRLEEERWAHLQ